MTKGYKTIKGKTWISEEKVIEILRKAKYETGSGTEEAITKEDKLKGTFFDSGYNNCVDTISEYLGIETYI